MAEAEEDVANRPLSSPRWSNEKWLEHKTYLDAFINISGSPHFWGYMIPEGLAPQTVMYLRQQRAKLFIRRQEIYDEYAGFWAKNFELHEMRSDGDAVGLDEEKQKEYASKLMFDIEYLKKDFEKLEKMKSKAREKYEEEMSRPLGAPWLDEMDDEEES